MRTKRQTPAPHVDGPGDVAKARSRGRVRSGEGTGGGRRWRLSARACWSLVDSFELDGARYVVAREHPILARGFEALTAREREAVTCLARGSSTKEAAYALGITDVTVRVLIARAATKLGVRTRRELLAHAEVEAHVARTT